MTPKWKEKTEKIVWIIFFAGLGHIAGVIISHIMISGYESTGNLITAKDTFELKILPYTFAIIGAWVGYKINEDE